ncbi:MAG: TIGR02206 family membrane protein [bacterium]
MATQFTLFGVYHCFFIALILFVPALLTKLSLGYTSRVKHFRYSLGGVILVNELAWYFYVFIQGWFNFPYMLPIHLCDIVLWLTVYTCFTNKSWSFDIIYYWGLAGTSMAVLTPDITSSAFSYLTLRFFLAHGGILIAILFLLWSKQSRPRKGSQWRAFGYLNLYALFIALFNYLFSANYFYLCEKPAESSLLDYLGPWPIYIFAGEVLALGFFWLLALPFRNHNKHS